MVSRSATLRDSTAAFAREACRHAGDGGHIRLRAMALAMLGRIVDSPEAADARQRANEIARRLDRMARDLGSDPLEVSAVKLDENFAAVLVRKIGGLDPSRLQVFPVALVKRGAEWSAAPLPASFENVGAGYATALRNRLQLLENWMLREQVVDLEKLREQSIKEMRRPRSFDHLRD